MLDVSARFTGLASEFVRRTGLPWDCQASVAKLLWFQDQGMAISSDDRWMSIPEYVVYRLGGDRVSEPSLASRTGLLDQASLDALGRRAAQPGPARHAAPSACRGRHLGRAAAFDDCCPPGCSPRRSPWPATTTRWRPSASGRRVPTSCSTPPARQTSWPARSPAGSPTHSASSSSATAPRPGPTCCRTRPCCSTGVRGGLVLRRVLQMLGADTHGQRDELDRLALEVGELPPGLEVSGAGPTGDEVVLRVRDEAGPAQVWTAATRYTAREAAAVLRRLDSVVGPHDRAVACGGWTRMASVRRAKSSVIARLEFSEIQEPGVLGAAILALRAAGLQQHPSRSSVVLR